MLLPSNKVVKINLRFLNNRFYQKTERFPMRNDETRVKKSRLIRRYLCFIVLYVTSRIHQKSFSQYFNSVSLDKIILENLFTLYSSDDIRQ